MQTDIEDFGNTKLPSKYLKQDTNREKRRKVSKACQNCKKSHVSCDDKRPCKRCIKKGLECLDDTLELSKNKLIMPKPDFSIFPNFSTPDCFSLAEPTYPVQGHAHLCHSKGLLSCLDCQFNINLQPGAVRSLIQSETFVNQSSGSNSFLSNSLIPESPFSDHYLAESISPLAPKDKDYKSVRILKQLLTKMNLEASVSCHIEYLVKQLYPERASLAELTAKDYIKILSSGLPSTPSALFSPNGIIFTSNLAFSQLVQIPTQELSNEFCIFSLLDMASILLILDMAHKFRQDSSTSFGKCSIEGSLNVKKLCAVSISIFYENDMAWIAAQFIPI